MTDTVADLTLARVNLVIAKLETMSEVQRDQTARLTAIEARIGAVESRLDIWNERIARVEVRLDLRDETTATP
jgi:hypothetical protein